MPERGECGFGESTAVLEQLGLGRDVTLVAGARDDRDRYDQILRSVDVVGRDAALELTREGLAIAHCDSRDGCGKYPRENVSIAPDAATPNDYTVAATLTPAPNPEPTPPPTITTFTNGDELNKVYSGGVAKTGSRDMVSGELRPSVVTPLFDDAIYNANTARD